MQRQALRLGQSARKDTPIHAFSLSILTYIEYGQIIQSPSVALDCFPLGTTSSEMNGVDFPAVIQNSANSTFGHLRIKSYRLISSKQRQLG